MQLLANDYVEIYRSPDPKHIFTYTPGIAVLPNGDLIATLDLGGPAMKGREDQGRILISTDKGASWEEAGSFPMEHARPFVSGGSVYILGQSGELRIIRSDDNGRSWSDYAVLADGKWHQSACNVLYAKGNVYLTMEKSVNDTVHGWGVGALAPVLMRARVGDNLLLKESWTFADAVPFRDLVDQDKLDYFGVPFYPVGRDESAYPGGRQCAPMGWLETNVAQITDPSHYWYNPSGRTFHIIGRANTGGTGYAAFAKAVENPDGTISTMLERMPSGRYAALLPLPGGQMRFHIEYDGVTKLYWLLSSQATDSMTRAELLPEDRYNLPNNERNRMQLHFSKNLVDWCFAGIVAIGKTQKCSRHYASMAIDGENLIIASRSGDENAASAHNGNFISFHTVKNFRSLVY